METITLNMTPSASLTTCHASQYDIGRQVRFNLVNGADNFVLSGGETVTLKIRRADGVFVENQVPNTSSNYVIWTSVAGECDASGISECELSVTDGGDLLGSANFWMEVEADPYDGAGVHVVTVGPADICTFDTTLPEPLQSVTVDIEATGGNGTPDSSIPINGYTEANITANGNTYTIAFGQTVYGGVLDVTRGKLHVTWGICDLADYNYIYNSTHGAFYTYGLIGTIKAGTANILCSHYKTNIVGVNVMNNYEISTVNSFNTGNVIIKDSDYTDAATFKTALGTMGAKLSFELATPFDIDLTPTQVRALADQENNVFADTGTTELKYLDTEA